MDKHLNLTVLTPNGIYYKGQVDYLEVRNADSVLGILPNHTPLVSTVKLGKVVIIIKGNRHYYACTGGLINIKKDSEVTLLVNTIERSNEIDVERAKRALKRAKQRLEDKKDNINVARAKAAIQRAELRIEVSNEKDPD